MVLWFKEAVPIADNFVHQYDEPEDGELEDEEDGAKKPRALPSECAICAIRENQPEHSTLAARHGQMLTRVSGELSQIVFGKSVLDRHC